jgi:hypothetical protein
VVVAAVRKAAQGRLDGEMQGKDEGRAARYVATVRPKQAATRYIPLGTRTVASEIKKRGADEEGDVAVQTTATEGTMDPTVAASTTATADDGAHEVMNVVMATEDEAQLPRKDLSPARRQAKKRRAARAASRAKDRVRLAKDAERAAVLAATTATLRQLQTEASRTALTARRTQQKTNGGNESVDDDKKAHVSLVQQASTAAAEGRLDTGAVRNVAADDGLPTALMEVSGSQRKVKLDSGARYTVAGTDWTAWGDKLSEAAPIDCVEGIGGFLLDLLGVWTFDLMNVFGQTVKVTACIVEGCTSEFLLGVDFRKAHQATMDFAKNEVRYEDSSENVVIPFRTFGGDGRDNVAPVRMVRRARLARSTVTPVEISVAAADGEKGIFVPGECYGSVLLATTVTEARDGKAWVPAINAGGSRVKLPPKKELGTWIPIDKDMKVLELNGEKSRERVSEWLKELGDNETPLDDEQDVNVGTEDQGGRGLVIRLLRAYRSVTGSKDACPPATKLPVRHHIDTGTAAPVMLKRRRQAQTEDAVTEENVDTMLGAGVIEEGNGAWGFPVVLVARRTVRSASAWTTAPSIRSLRRMSTRYRGSTRPWKL